MYHKTGQYKKEEKVYKRAEKDFPDDLELIGWQGILALSQGDTVAIQIIPFTGHRDNRNT
jgi:hypothetical protein